MGQGGPGKGKYDSNVFNFVRAWTRSVRNPYDQAAARGQSGCTQPYVICRKVKPRASWHEVSHSECSNLEHLKDAYSDKYELNSFLRDAHR